jgi:TolB-like protein/Tfp pilus assembly protein PilF
VDPVSEVPDQHEPPAPAGPFPGLPGLLAELRRRRVFRVLVGYGLFSFAVLQVVEPVLHAYHLPDWALTAVVTALGLGFPLALVLSWAYDLTAQGVRRTPAATGPGALVISRGRLVALLLGVGLLAALPGAGWYALNRGRQPPAGETAGPPSVAVLPFLNMSGDPENEYFSDGLSEEILNALAQVPGLRVTARTSSFAFKGKQESVRRIAEALQVTNVLEGSVRKAGGRVRITAQLIKAADGYHLWSEVFERELKDVFAVQDEIAAAITGALKVQLATAPAVAAGAPATTRKGGTTSNTAAYDAYLKGRHELNERGAAAMEKAIAYFQKAVALDPKFAVAWADLSVAIVLQARGNYGGVPLWQAIARARTYLEKAQALAPDHPAVLAAAGQIALNAIQPAKGLEYLDRSLALNPSNTEALNWRRNALEALGQFDQLFPAAAAALKADPFSKLSLTNYIDELARFGREAEVGPAVERLRAVDEAWGQVQIAGAASRRGDHVEAVRHLLPALLQGASVAAAGLVFNLAEMGLAEEALRVPGADPYTIAMIRGDFPKAEALARAAVRASPDDPTVRLDLIFALYGRRMFAEAAALGEQNVRELGGLQDLDAGSLAILAHVAREAGRPAEAARYRDRAGLLVDRMAAAGVVPLFVDFLRGRLAAYDGRDGEAVALLHGALTFTGASWGRADLKMPLFDRLLRRPDYQAALKGLDGILATQRTQVVAMLCGPQRLSENWQPAPETCAGAATAGSPR